MVDPGELTKQKSRSPRPGICPSLPCTTTDFRLEISSLFLKHPVCLVLSHTLSQPTLFYIASWFPPCLALLVFPFALIILFFLSPTRDLCFALAFQWQESHSEWLHSFPAFAPILFFSSVLPSLTFLITLYSFTGAYTNSIQPWHQLSFRSWPASGPSSV